LPRPTISRMGLRVSTTRRRKILMTNWRKHCLFRIVPHLSKSPDPYADETRVAMAFAKGTSKVI
jgi:hypothetical protein